MTEVVIAWVTGQKSWQAADMRIDQLLPNADLELARTLLALQRAAYGIEATLIGDDRIPGLHESVEDLQCADLVWLVASLHDIVVGAVAWSESDDELDIDRLIVAPRAHRRGVGSALMGALMQRARGRRIIVSTGHDNTPARAMYERLGFVKVEDDEVLPGLTITRYRWLAG